MLIYSIRSCCLAVVTIFWQLISSSLERCQALVRRSVRMSIMHPPSAKSPLKCEDGRKRKTSQYLNERITSETFTILLVATVGSSQRRTVSPRVKLTELAPKATSTNGNCPNRNDTVPNHAAGQEALDVSTGITTTTVIVSTTIMLTTIIIVTIT